MNTKETIAKLFSIIDFYKNDGHFIAEGEAEKEIEALMIAIRRVEIYDKLIYALDATYSLSSRHYTNIYLQEIKLLLDEVTISKMETVQFKEDKTNERND